MRVKGKKLLALRDVNGRFMRVARDKQDQKQLTRWYHRWNLQQRLEDLITNAELKQEVLQAKEKVRGLGFPEQISFYGIFRNPSSGKAEYRRYEVFAKEPFTRADIETVYEYFYRNPPDGQAGVYIYLPPIKRLVEICLLHPRRK
jgi:hypothetical protein